MLNTDVATARIYIYIHLCCEWRKLRDHCIHRSRIPLTSPRRRLTWPMLTSRCVSVEGRSRPNPTSSIHWPHPIVTISSWPLGRRWEKVRHDDVIKWKHLSRHWLYVRGIHRSPVNSPYKGQWRGAVMSSLICAWINVWVNNREASELRCHRAYYDFTVMVLTLKQKCRYSGDIFVIGLTESCPFWQFPVKPVTKMSSKWWHFLLV